MKDKLKQYLKVFICWLILFIFIFGYRVNSIHKDIYIDIKEYGEFENSYGEIDKFSIDLEFFLNSKVICNIKMVNGKKYKVRFYYDDKVISGYKILNKN